MKLKIDTDIRALGLRLKQEPVRVGKALVRALNNTAVEIQRQERINLDRAYTLRKAGFMYRLIKVRFANTKDGRPYAEVYVDDTKKNVLLSLFEEGGEKRSEHGANVAVPITGEAARPSFESSVPTSLYISRLGLRQGRNGQLQGRQKTFVLRQTAKLKDGGVFIRTSADDVRLLYKFERAPRLRATLHFMRTALRVYDTMFVAEFNRLMERGGR